MPKLRRFRIERQSASSSGKADKMSKKLVTSTTTISNNNNAKTSSSNLILAKTSIPYIVYNFQRLIMQQQTAGYQLPGHLVQIINNLKNYNTNNENNNRFWSNKIKVIVKVNETNTEQNQTNINLGNNNITNFNNGTTLNNTNNCVTINKAQSCIGLIDPTPSRRNQSSSSNVNLFPFDVVLTDQDQSYNLCTHALMNSIPELIRGRDTCIFSFGHSSLGKTGSMIGSDKSLEDFGVIPSALVVLFGIFDELKLASGKISVALSAGIIGKGGNVIDLLAESKVTMPKESTVSNQKSANHKALMLQTELTANNLIEAVRILDFALATKTRASLLNSNNQNDCSAERLTHFQLIIHLYQHSQQPSNNNNLSEVKYSRLILLDLGSGRHSSDDLSNMSLQGMSKVLLALYTSQLHIPHRDTNLTKMLRESIQTNCHSVMLLHLSNKQQNYNETLQVVQLASKLYRNRARRPGRSNNSSIVNSSNMSEDAISSSCGSSSSGCSGLRRPRRPHMGIGAASRGNTSSGTASSDWEGGGTTNTSASEMSACETVIFIGSPSAKHCKSNNSVSSESDLILSDRETSNISHHSFSSPTAVRRRKVSPRTNARAWPSSKQINSDEEQNSLELWVDGPKAVYNKCEETFNDNSNQVENSFNIVSIYKENIDQLNEQFDDKDENKKMISKETQCENGFWWDSSSTVTDGGSSSVSTTPLDRSKEPRPLSDISECTEETESKWDSHSTDDHEDSHNDSNHNNGSNVDFNNPGSAIDELLETAICMGVDGLQSKMTSKSLNNNELNYGNTNIELDKSSVTLTTNKAAIKQWQTKTFQHTQHHQHQESPNFTEVGVPPLSAHLSTLSSTIEISSASYSKNSEYKSKNIKEESIKQLSSNKRTSESPDSCNNDNQIKSIRKSNRKHKQQSIIETVGATTSDTAPKQSPNTNINQLQTKHYHSAGESHRCSASESHEHQHKKNKIKCKKCRHNSEIASRSKSMTSSNSTDFSRVASWIENVEKEIHHNADVELANKQSFSYTLNHHNQNTAEIQDENTFKQFSPQYCCYDSHLNSKNHLYHSQQPLQQPYMIQNPQNSYHIPNYPQSLPGNREYYSRSSIASNQPPLPPIPPQIQHHNNTAEFQKPDLPLNISISNENTNINYTQSTVKPKSKTLPRDLYSDTNSPIKRNNSDLHCANNTPAQFSSIGNANNPSLNKDKQKKEHRNIVSMLFAPFISLKNKMHKKDIIPKNISLQYSKTETYGDMEKSYQSTNKVKMASSSASNHSNWPVSPTLSNKVENELILNSPYHLITAPKTGILPTESSGHGSDSSSTHRGVVRNRDHRQNHLSHRSQQNHNNNSVINRHSNYHHRNYHHGHNQQRPTSSGYGSSIIIRGDSEPSSSHNDSSSEYSISGHKFVPDNFASNHFNGRLRHSRSLSNCKCVSEPGCSSYPNQQYSVITNNQFNTDLSPVTPMLPPPIKDIQADIKKINAKAQIHLSLQNVRVAENLICQEKLKMSLNEERRLVIQFIETNRLRGLSVDANVMNLTCFKGVDTFQVTNSTQRAECESLIIKIDQEIEVLKHKLHNAQQHLNLVTSFVSTNNKQ